jgi:hypothetical protein
MYEKITELSMQLRGINETLREEYKARKAEYESRKAADEEYAKQSQHALKEKEQVIKEKLEAEARNKLQKGEKLSWNEFQDAEDEDKETKN